MSAEPEPSNIDETPFLDGMSDAKSRYGRFNLAVIGATGVGKSSLVNAVFGRDLAKVGKGLPVTRGVHYYSDDSLGIWDVEGFEIGTPVPAAEQLRGHLQEIAKRPKNEQISVVWYCVKSNDDRLAPHEIAMIDELSRAGLPVILVLTKVDWSRNPITGQRGVSKSVEEFVNWLENPVDGHGQPMSIGYERVILTSTSDKHGKGKGHGLGELVAETLSLSPKNEQDAFRIAQRLNLPWKRELARPVIAAATAAAAGAATVPLPVADAVTLAPIQLGMMARIAVIYDIEMKTALSTSSLANLGAQLAGRALASSLIKLIPGAGSVVNAGVAAALTGATGEGWLRLCEHVHTGKIRLDQMDEAWNQYVPGFLDVIRKMAEQRVGK